MEIEVSRKQFREVLEGKPFLVTDNCDFTVGSEITIKETGTENKFNRKIIYVNIGDGLEDGYALLGFENEISLEFKSLQERILRREEPKENPWSPFHRVTITPSDWERLRRNLRTERVQQVRITPSSSPPPYSTYFISDFRRDMS